MWPGAGGEDAEHPHVSDPLLARPLRGLPRTVPSRLVASFPPGITRAPTAVNGPTGHCGCDPVGPRGDGSREHGTRVTTSIVGLPRTERGTSGGVADAPPSPVDVSPQTRRPTTREVPAGRDF